MYGWRARLGVIVGSSMVVVEPDYNRMTPEGVTCHFTKIPFFAGRAGLAPGEPVQPSHVIEELRGMGGLAVDVVEILTHVKPSAIALA